ncbi:MAG: DUF3343 domain-containing protein [Clostridia bacterium]|nr:DUF3343 domain-containing protein [Clostridia bacterium]
MTYYYTALPTRSSAFLLEHRMRSEGIKCELTYMPREIMTDLCTLGVKFEEYEYPRAVNAIKKSGIPDCRLYREIVYPDYCQYVAVEM